MEEGVDRSMPLPSLKTSGLPTVALSPDTTRSRSSLLVSLSTFIAAPKVIGDTYGN